ncbi:unnamed protein product [Symbiodinium natans]|uniref:Methyltransferase domain-containing protein n=1 Tax=Symbiodinium natans TaxID=878477 RepID=A0A812I2U4_9DINO|nr:unnamed protein product [Symbiodinium natans]
MGALHHADDDFSLDDCCTGWWTSKDPGFIDPVRDCLDTFMRVLVEEPSSRNPHHLHGSFYARLLASSGQSDLSLAEVGVDEGAFMEAMLQELAWLGVSVKKYYAIDPWTGRFAHLQQALEVAMRFDHVHLIQETGDTARRMVDDETMDFVFVDAVHTVPFVSLHLRGWWPKVRPGGIIAGHDFAREKPWRFPGPVAAAITFAEEMGLSQSLLGLHGTTFAMQKPRV